MPSSSSWVIIRISRRNEIIFSTRMIIPKAGSSSALTLQDFGIIKQYKNEPQLILKNKTLNIMRFQKMILPVVFVAVAGFTVERMNDPWPVPDKFVKMPNPIKVDAESVSAGKELWIKHC